jgi:hypothetical protein
MTSATPITATYLFETNTFVLWAEEVAREIGIPCEVIPAPPPRGDLCGTALRVLESGVVVLEEAMANAGIPFHRFAEAPGSGS